MKIVLAYSGGLDTSVILRWLKENYQAEIVAFCADIGQEEELAGLDQKALSTGATKCVIDDLREEFARDFIFPMMQAGAIYEGQYFLGTSIARPLIAKRMVEIARAEKADAIAHPAANCLRQRHAQRLRQQIVQRNLDRAVHFGCIRILAGAIQKLDAQCVRIG